MNAKFILPVLFALVSAPQAHAAQGAAKAKIKVIAAVAVTKVSDLLFTEATAGTAAETVPAGTTESTENASFTVSGEASRAIAVTLPIDGTVKMVTPSGSGADAEIPVNQFTSNGPTAIGAGGTTDLFVGATRDALTATQVAGDYEGDFVVDVIYN